MAADAEATGYRAPRNSLEWRVYDPAGAKLRRGSEAGLEHPGLVAHYLLDRTAVDRLAAAARAGAGAPPGHPLLPTVAADAAFWRRCRALVAAAVG